MKVNKNNTEILIISSMLIVFILIAVLTSLFSSTELPVQIAGVLLEAAVTALITYFLLRGQSSSEEVKERNVKVFEEKSVRFNDFIKKLWSVWDDRSINLEELSDLVRIVSQDIIIFTQPERVKKILDYLIDIAKLANPYETDSTNEQVTSRIQQNIFKIINELADEIGLGGQIDMDIELQLNKLDKLIFEKTNESKNIL
jgi:membrane protein implicated in regulation of membrane protease activity